METPARPWRLSRRRYILGEPAVFLALAKWGRSPACDRAWTVAWVLLMGWLAALYTYNMWAG